MRRVTDSVTRHMELNIPDFRPHPVLQICEN